MQEKGRGEGTSGWAQKRREGRSSEGDVEVICTYVEDPPLSCTHTGMTDGLKRGH